jgi:hypothetical protein
MTMHLEPEHLRLPSSNVSGSHRAVVVGRSNFRLPPGPRRRMDEKTMDHIGRTGSVSAGLDLE